MFSRWSTCAGKDQLRGVCQSARDMRQFPIGMYNTLVTTTSRDSIGHAYIFFFFLLLLLSDFNQLYSQGLRGLMTAILAV